MRGDGPADEFDILALVSFSPRAWGWSDLPGSRSGAQRVLPTCVGMVRTYRMDSALRERSPHVRGDGPTRPRPGGKGLAFSPRAWGWSASGVEDEIWDAVLPTCVGMVPYDIEFSGNLPFSPRAWGWSGSRTRCGPVHWVLPTCVGMVRPRGIMIPTGVRSPHVRGDGPKDDLLIRLGRRFSPRAWGWSGHRKWNDRYAKVLPTCVGMVRNRSSLGTCLRGSPHVRGDGPLIREHLATLGEFSPRAWGWSELLLLLGFPISVLPTCVGMVRNFLHDRRSQTRSPHVRGDGPKRCYRHVPIRRFSPRAWGWSALRFAARRLRQVLPTCVGMVR